MLRSVSFPRIGVLGMGAVAALALGLGCQDRGDRGDRPDQGNSSASRAVAAEPAPSPAPRWAGSQEELAAAIDQAAQSVEPGANRQVRERWLGQPVRWTVWRVPQLCGAEGTCYVQPFSNARRSDTGAHGWLPEVELTARERQALLAGCGARALCQVTLEARVDELVVSDEAPTSIRLGGARVVATGDA